MTSRRDRYKGGGSRRTECRGRRLTGGQPPSRLSRCNSVFLRMLMCRYVSARPSGSGSCNYTRFLPINAPASDDPSEVSRHLTSLQTTSQPPAFRPFRGTQSPGKSSPSPSWPSDQITARHQPRVSVLNGLPGGSPAGSLVERYRRFVAATPPRSQSMCSRSNAASSRSGPGESAVGSISSSRIPASTLYLSRWGARERESAPGNRTSVPSPFRQSQSGCRVEAPPTGSDTASTQRRPVLGRSTPYVPHSPPP